jgi:hypothetical protein
MATKVGLYSSIRGVGASQAFRLTARQNVSLFASAKNLSQEPKVAKAQSEIGISLPLRLAVKSLALSLRRDERAWK